MEKILIIEDEPDMLMGLKDNLEFEGYTVCTARDGLEALALAQKEKPELIVLDLMLPKMDGYEVCKRIRARGSTVPIIMLTAKSQEVDKVLGLELGADDYITKPFSVRELSARIRAVLRRLQPKQPKLDAYKFGNVEIDFRKSTATRGRRRIELTHYELEMLRLLITHKEEPVSRNQLLNEVWGYELYPTTRTIDNHVVKLRQKLEADPKNPKHVVTVHGIGYKFMD